MPKRLPFPGADSELNIYFQTVIKYLTDNDVRLLLLSATLVALNAELAIWNDYFPKSQNDSIRTKTITQLKNESRENLIVLLRAIYRNIPFGVFTTEDRNTFDLPLKKERRMLSPIPDSIPVGTVDVSERLQHSIIFFNDSGSKAKPYLCRGCQIWYKIGEKPTDVSEMQYMATASKSPHLHVYAGEHAGKPIYYWFRWENTVGKTGPWSKVVMATLVG